MIWIFNLERASAGSCDNYDDVYQYITSLENLMGTEFLEISTSDTTLVKKQWCIEFCKSHNYIIVETPCPATDPNKTPWNSNIYTTPSEDLVELIN